MAMIEFEDREPGPPLSWGDRLLVGIATILSIYGVVATVWSLLP
jgi:hypothetical protein